MRHVNRLVTAVGIMALCGGCATTKVRLYQKGEKPKNVGIPIREPIPYLLVTSEVVTDRKVEGLFTYNVRAGFLPVCDGPLSDMAARRGCIDKVNELKLGAGAKPAAAPRGDHENDPGAVSLVAFKAGTPKKTTAKDGKTGDDADFNPKDVSEPGKDDGTKKGTDTPKAEPPKDEKKATDPAAPPTPPSPPLQIVYLPSLCQVYGLSQTNVLASSKIDLTLTNGWQLTSVSATGDSTAVVSKLLDTIASVVGSIKGVPSTGGGADSKKGAGADKTAQGGPPEDLYAKVTTRYLAPWLYPLTKCNLDGTFDPIQIPEPKSERTEWILALAKAETK